MTITHTSSERLAESWSPEQQREYERKAVASHYENEPEIFSLVLGRTMAYATGVFLHPDESLETGEQRKLERIREKLSLQPGSRVLDVGCGWGSIGLHLAERCAIRVDGITLSAVQQRVVLERAQERGLSDRVEVEVCHIDELDRPAESYDAIVFSGSIVHMNSRRAVHQKVGRLLRPGGRLLTSDCTFPAELRGDRGSRANDYIFVQTFGYVRPLALWEELRHIEEAGLDVIHLEDLSSSYAITLGKWIENVRAHRDRINELAPGFAKSLYSYMTLCKTSLEKRTALEYMTVAVKGRPPVPAATWFRDR